MEPLGIIMGVCKPINHWDDGLYATAGSIQFHISLTWTNTGLYLELPTPMPANVNQITILLRSEQEGEFMS